MEGKLQKFCVHQEDQNLNHFFFPPGQKFPNIRDSVQPQPSAASAGTGISETETRHYPEPWFKRVLGDNIWCPTFPTSNNSSLEIMKLFSAGPAGWQENEEFKNLGFFRWKLQSGNFPSGSIELWWGKKSKIWERIICLPLLAKSW